MSTHWTDIQATSLAMTMGLAVSAVAQPAIPTTVSAAGAEDQEIVIRLGRVTPGATGVVTGSIITELPTPSAGALLQFDGTPITSAPAEVTDPAHRVRFQPAPNENGAPVASLWYAVTGAGQGGASPACRVRLIVPPVNDPPSLWIGTYGPISEDGPTMLRLAFSDPDLSREGDVVRARMIATVSPSFGTFYQVGEDNTTIGAPIPIGAVVTNPSGYIHYVPTANYWGNSANFIWRAEDAAGAVSSDAFITLNVQPVNDPPSALPVYALGNQFNTQMPLQLGASDIDTPVTGITMTLLSLPTKGDVYVGGLMPENRVTTAGGTIPVGTAVWYVKTASGLGNPWDEFSYTVSDGEYTSAPASIKVGYSYTNVAPVPEVPAPLTVDEDSDWTEITLTASDVDGPASEQRFYIMALPTKGVLQARNVLDTGWFTITSPFTMAGPPGGSALLRFKPLTNANTFGGSPDGFVFKVSDLSDESALVSVPITIRAVNDAPAITGPVLAIARITVPGGVNINAVIDTLAVTDDAGTQAVRVTISAPTAEALVFNSTQGLVGFAQPTPSSATFEAPVSAVNAAFAAGIQVDPLTYGSGVISVTVNDLGGTGEENPPVEKSATHTVTFVVTN